MKSILINSLNVKIARDLGIRPEDVTLDLMRDWREEHEADECEYETESPHGGHIVEGLLVLCPAEEQRALREADLDE